MIKKKWPSIENELDGFSEYSLSHNFLSCQGIFLKKNSVFLFHFIYVFFLPFHSTGTLGIYYGLQFCDFMRFLYMQMSESLFLVPFLELFSFYLFILYYFNVLVFILSHIISHYIIFLKLLFHRNLFVF